jgi:Spy/CpxP family protein refolding chaperone
MKRRAYLYFLFTLLLGVVVGGTGVFFYAWYWGHWHRGGDRQHIVRYMTHELDLSSTQVQQLNQILDDTAKKYEALRNQVGPQFRAIREESHERIRKILTPQQLEKFNQMLRRREQRGRGAPPHR